MLGLKPPSPRVSCGVGDVPQTVISVSDEAQPRARMPLGSFHLPAPHPTSPVVERSSPSRSATRSYMRRRFEYMNRQEDDDDGSGSGFSESKFQPGSIASLPLAVQIGFRRKMLSIFAMQLLLLTGLVALLTYHPSLSDLIERGFEQPVMNLIPLVLLLATLGGVYLARAKFPLNWVLVLLFSCELSVFLAGVQVWIATNAALYCCGFTFLVVAIMVPLSGLKRQRRRRQQVPEVVVTTASLEPSTAPTETVLRSSMFAGGVGFVVTAIIAAALFGSFRDDFVTPETFGYALLFELVLVAWFAYDATSMYNVMTPDEYMNGVVYFYLDLLALVALTLVFGGVLVACTALGPGAGIGYCDFYGCCLVRSRRGRDADPDADMDEEHNHEDGDQDIDRRGSGSSSRAAVVPDDRHS